MDPKVLVTLLTQVLTLIPVASFFATQVSAYRAKMQSIADAGGVVTDADWAEIDAEVANKLAQLNAR